MNNYPEIDKLAIAVDSSGANQRLSGILSSQYSLLFESPEYLVSPASWMGHIPFAFWAVETLRPGLLVELGTYTGNSYCAFCQAVSRLDLDTACYAVDSWQGDPHTGYYGDDIYAKLAAYHDPKYDRFSRLIRSTFDQALDRFEDGSIDLLHIDGYHTYEAISHDFAKWRPKLSTRSVVLFHDVNVLDGDFGVDRFWREVCRIHPSFRFLHSNGLGILGIGENIPAPLCELLSPSLPDWEKKAVRRHFAYLGSHVQRSWEVADLEQRGREMTRHISRLQESESRLREIEPELADARQKAAGWERRAAELEAELNHHHKNAGSALQDAREKAEGWERRAHQLEEQLANLSAQFQETSARAETLRQSLDAEREQNRAAKARHKTELDDAHQRHLSDLQRFEWELRDTRESLGDEISALRSSWSWRITSPIRSTVRGILGARMLAFRLMCRIRLALLRATPAFRAAVERVQASSLFDADYYTSRYPDVLRSGMPAVEHFVAFGGAEGRHPHPLFDTGFYLAQHPELAAGQQNPLLHYLDHGLSHKCTPHPLFDAEFYGNHTPEIEATGQTPLAHFVQSGALEGRCPHPWFDTSFYRYTLGGPEAAGTNPLLHYIESGAASGHAPHPLFNSGFYRYELEGHDIPNPLLHYIQNSATNGVPPNPDRLSPLSLVVREAVARCSLPALSGTINTELSFPVIDHPEVSIIIPFHNKVEWTLRCLQAIRDNTDGPSYEIICVDDCSTDERAAQVAGIPGLRVLRPETNVGYLRATNMGAAQARGRYILLLNNDTLPLPGWLSALHTTFEEFPRAGLAGSCLLYPDGRLQEAGGIIWESGGGWNLGRLQAPEKPEFSYARRTDYCSAAATMIPAELWNNLCGFDDAFAPAYYEDSDLAFRIRQMGHDVIYQPLARVVHFEGISHGREQNPAMKRLLEKNRRTFLERWSPVIKDYGDPDTFTGFFRDRYSTGHVLVIDSCTPTPDQDSGSNDTRLYLDTLRKLGFHVTFAPAHNMLHFGRYTDELQRTGIECLYRPFVYSLDEYLQQEGGRFDIVILFREPVATEYLPAVKRHAPQARVIFHTVDLHGLRETRMAQASGNESELRHASQTQAREYAAIAAADHTIVVSAFEKQLVERDVPNADIRFIPLGRPVRPSQNGFDQRRDILFVGGFRHQPNIDAATFLVREVWPLLKDRIPDASLRIVGSNTTGQIRALAGDRCKVEGFVPDLDRLLEECRVTVAPLRWGAGLKGKVITSLCQGVPCVATSIAIEGSGLKHNHDVLVADDAQGLADQIFEIYQSRQLWERISATGLTTARQRFSETTVSQTITDMLASEDLLPQHLAGSVRA